MSEYSVVVRLHMEVIQIQTVSECLRNFRIELDSGRFVPHDVSIRLSWTSISVF